MGLCIYVLMNIFFLIKIKDKWKVEGLSIFMNRQAQAIVEGRERGKSGYWD